MGPGVETRPCVNSQHQAAHPGDVSKNPDYVTLHKIWAAKTISKTIATSQNHIYLTADNLVLNLDNESFTQGSDSLVKDKKWAW